MDASQEPNDRLSSLNFYAVKILPQKKPTITMS